MPEALRWRSKALLFKIEATYGVDPTPTQAILATDVVCRPMEGEDVSRDVMRPWFGAQEMFPVGMRVALEFDVEIVGGGTAGTAPPIGPLLRACALAETIVAVTSVTYNRISSAHESAAFYFWIGGNKQAILGARGNAVFSINAQGIPRIRFIFTGLWAAPAAAALPTIDTTAFKTPLVATHVNTPVFTVDAVSLVLRSYSFDLGNVVEPRLLIGGEGIVITDSDEKITVAVEAVPVATYNPFTRATGMTKFPVVIRQDTRAGYKVQINAPLCQQRRLEGYENQQGVVEWPLAFAPLPSDTGNDQLSIVFT